MSDFETIQDIVRKAYQGMTPDVWDFVAGGAESETTLRRNRLALDSLAFRPRVLRDVTKIDPSTTLLGRDMRIPVFLAPVAGLEQVHPEGALPALRAASEFGIMMFLAAINQLDLETAARGAGENLVFQLYMRGDDTWLDAYLDRVKKARCRGFCLTVDTALYSRRERDLVNGYAPPGRRGRPRKDFDYQATMTWDLVDRVRERLDIPLILKGIATAEDARMAVDHGVDVVYVSNHGGRQLDHGRGSIDVLPEVIAAVEGRAEVVVDSGFVRGTDVLKAVALGARAVGIGKLMVWAIAAGGDAAVERMLALLETEITVSMGLLGITRLDQLDPSYLAPEKPVIHPDTFSPFPSLGRLIGG